MTNSTGQISYVHSQEKRCAISLMSNNGIYKATIKVLNGVCGDGGLTSISCQRAPNSANFVWGELLFLSNYKALLILLRILVKVQWVS